MTASQSLHNGLFIRPTQSYFRVMQSIINVIMLFCKYLWSVSKIVTIIVGLFLQTNSINALRVQNIICYHLTFFVNKFSKNSSKACFKSISHICSNSTVVTFVLQS